MPSVVHLSPEYSYTAIPVEQLGRLQGELMAFRESEELNGFQRWIVDELYDLRVPQADFAIKSIILVAAPHPLYARVTVSHRGARYHCLSLVSADFEGARASLEKTLGRSSSHLQEAKNLPLKRLAVHCGFATYGKNNITYIDGYGSSFSYVAFFSDAPGDNDSWLPVRHDPVCDACQSCQENCPTGAIRKDRFLIDNARCLSCLNETAEPFPDWLSPSVHHTLYDCLRCQIPCPLNKGQAQNIGRDIEFTEEETDALIAGTGMGAYPETLREKARYLGLDKWPAGIAKNIAALIEARRAKATVR